MIYMIWMMQSRIITTVLYLGIRSLSADVQQDFSVHDGTQLHKTDMRTIIHTTAKIGVMTVLQFNFCNHRKIGHVRFRHALLGFIEYFLYL